VFSIFLGTLSVVLSTSVPRMLDVYYNVEVQLGPSSIPGSNSKSGTRTFMASEVSFYKDNKLNSRMDAPSSVYGSKTTYASGI
jgi:hypothetical protein